MAGYVLVAPAVWGRARMNIFMRSGLWLAATLAPGMEVSRPPPPIHVYASDNIPALIRLGRDPLTLLETRFDTLRGLVDLMDTALDAAPHFRAPALFMYGGKDELVPKPATLATWRALPGDADAGSLLSQWLASADARPGPRRPHRRRHRLDPQSPRPPAIRRRPGGHEMAGSPVLTAPFHCPRIRAM